MKFKKVLIALSVSLVLVASTSVGVSANEVVTVSTQTVDDSIEPRADIIETKYRLTPDGRLQYRRWNSTRGYWVDDKWLDF